MYMFEKKKKGCANSYSNRLEGHVIAAKKGNTAPMVRTSSNATIIIKKSNNTNLVRHFFSK